MDPKDNAGVIAPPPLIYLAGLAVGLILDRTVPLPIEFAWPAAGIVVAVSGVVLMAWGIREFRRAGTHFRPDKPSTRVIAAGPFRFTRNPLYVSMTLMYGGIAVGLGSPWAMALLVPVLAVIRYGVIAREERYLERKFGVEYLAFKNSVRRWI